MALLMNDDHIKCPKCSGIELAVQSAGIFRLLETKDGHVLEEEHTGNYLVCSACGARVMKLAETVKHIVK